MYLTQKTTLSVVFCLICTPIVFGLNPRTRFVKLRVSSKGMRIIDKNGIESVLTDMRARGEKV